MQYEAVLSFIFNDHISNVRETWIGINQLTGRNKGRGKAIVTIPNVLNDFFSSLGQTLVPPDNHRFSGYPSLINSSC